ncbi:spore protease YyaC [Bacillus massiliigorillae]|uniref:spore protease YyaC n=1 Tax=Bacillus massiliigorillae TaxID=1243664 RepID=UPI0003A5F10D|nr:spore protease YyaC [Bacillus massiliigorillae]
MNVKRSFLDLNSNKKHTPFEDHDAVEKISLNLLSSIPANRPKSIVVACIGTDRSTGDSLGPLVGTYLTEKPNSPFLVYGTLENPIHAVNLQEKVQEIKEKHHDAFIIAVDACLGRMKNVGTVQIGDGPLKPGAGVNKNLPEVGDIHVTGIVNVSGFMEFFVLQNTRLNLVVKMAKTIADSIYVAGESLTTQTPFNNLSWTFDHKEATT